MINLFKRYSISILNKNWQPIRMVAKVKHIPRHGEFIYLEETKKYYTVLNVVYYLNNKQGIFIIVEEFGNQRPTN